MLLALLYLVDAGNSPPAPVPPVEPVAEPAAPAVSEPTAADDSVDGKPAAVPQPGK